MPKFAANLSMLFTEVPFLDRFKRAAQTGFTAVEFLFPYTFAAAEIKQRLESVGFVVPAAGSGLYTQFVKSEIDLWTQVIKTAGIKSE